MQLSKKEQMAKQWNQKISFDYRDQIEKDDLRNNDNLVQEMMNGCSTKWLGCK